VPCTRPTDNDQHAEEVGTSRPHHRPDRTQPVAPADPNTLSAHAPVLAAPEAGTALVHPSTTPDLDTNRLLGSWLSTKAEPTAQGYLRDLNDIATTLGLDSPHALIEAITTATPAATADALDAYRIAARTGNRPGARTKGRLSPAAINRALAAARSLVTHLARRGLITWTLAGLVPDEPSEAYRDTRGPGIEPVAAMLQVAQAQPGVRSARNVAIIRCLWDQNLRRAEVVDLDIEHVDLAHGRLSVLGKGKRERRWYTLTPQTAAAISTYLGELGRPETGPLFVSLGPDRKTPTGKRLSGGGLYRVVRALAKAAGVTAPVSPHRIRHSTTTDALDRLDGDVRTARGFTRHSSVETLLRYDDARRDAYGTVARGQAEALDDAAS